MAGELLAQGGGPPPLNKVSAGRRNPADDDLEPAWVGSGLLKIDPRADQMDPENYFAMARVNHPNLWGGQGLDGGIHAFCSMLTFVFPSETLYRLLRNWALYANPSFSPQFYWGLKVDTAVLALVTLSGVVTALRLWSGDPRGKIIARRYLLFSTSILIACLALTTLLLRDLPTPEWKTFNGIFLITFLSHLIFCFWGLWYFFFSESVHYTYDDDLIP